MVTQVTNEYFQKAYEIAIERYASIGVDTEEALKKLESISISLHCWQGDDVGGFENEGQELGGGLAVTGNYPGKARSADELRQDLNKTYSLIPGRHRLAFHAMYGEFGGKKVDRHSPPLSRPSGLTSPGAAPPLASALRGRPTRRAHARISARRTGWFRTCISR